MYNKDNNDNAWTELIEPIIKRGIIKKEEINKEKEKKEEEEEIIDKDANRRSMVRI